MKKPIPKNARKYHAFFGGEESGLTLEQVSTIWDAAIKSVLSFEDVIRWAFTDYNTYNKFIAILSMSATDEMIFENVKKEMGVE